MSTPTHLDRLGFGYDLDGGGYSFDRASYPETGDQGSIVSIDSGFDYIDTCELIPWDAHVVLFNVGGGDLPKTLTDPDGDRLVRVVEWTTFETDRECDCYGHDEDGEWQYTGNYSDPPRPDCHRCDGDGYVVSGGGSWAAYVLLTIPHDADDTPGAPWDWADASACLDWINLAWSIGDEDDRAVVFDFAAGLYWFCHDHHSGQWSDEYAVLSGLGYRPGALETGPPDCAVYVYDRLVAGAR